MFCTTLKRVCLVYHIHVFTYNIRMKKRLLKIVVLEPHTWKLIGNCAAKGHSKINCSIFRVLHRMLLYEHVMFQSQ